MNTLECDRCSQRFPMNDMLKALETGKYYCETCAEQALQDPDEPLEGEIERLVDPTLCFNCGHDHGSNSLPEIVGLPVCKKCEDFFRHRPFPRWIKLSAIAVMLIVAFSVFWNMRFIQAYREIKSSYGFMAYGDYEQAVAMMSSAVDRVPESEELKVEFVYMQGVSLLQQDKSAEALEKFKQCENRLPPQYQVDIGILRARIGVAFKAADYDEFLECAKTLEQRYPDDFMSKATVASAYACKYADTGVESFQNQALNSLAQAREMANNHPYFTEYENRILHRIHSKEIITSEEFKRRFPDGWKQPSTE